MCVRVGLVSGWVGGVSAVALKPWCLWLELGAVRESLYVASRGSGEVRPRCLVWSWSACRLLNGLGKHRAA